MPLDDEMTIALINQIEAQLTTVRNAGITYLPFEGLQLKGIEDVEVERLNPRIIQLQVYAPKGKSPRRRVFNLHIAEVVR